jgi:hypothetical protein
MVGKPSLEAIFEGADSTSQRIEAYREVATSKTSCGERKPRDLRGRALNKRSTLATSAGVTVSDRMDGVADGPAPSARLRRRKLGSAARFS